MVKSGKILLSDTLDNVKETHLRVTLVFAEPRHKAPDIDGILIWEGSGREWTGVYRGQVGQLEAAAALLGAEIVNRNGLSLDDIFVAHVGAGQPS
jgi:hypothetical protein